MFGVRWSHALLVLHFFFFFFLFIGTYKQYGITFFLLYTRIEPHSNLVLSHAYCITLLLTTSNLMLYVSPKHPWLRPSPGGGVRLTCNLYVFPFVVKYNLLPNDSHINLCSIKRKALSIYKYLTPCVLFVYHKVPHYMPCTTLCHITFQLFSLLNSARW